MASTYGHFTAGQAAQKKRIRGRRHGPFFTAGQAAQKRTAVSQLLRRIYTPRNANAPAELRAVEATTLECFAEQRDQANRASRLGAGKGARQSAGTK